MVEIYIGEKIRQGREINGLSQSQFAEKLYVSKQAVGKWERNESLPNLSMLAEIGKVIGITDLNYFLGSEIKLCSCGADCTCRNTCKP
jgi:transcriptional regulator with XRE-family HTH domain